ncbi:MAG: hypothetical protein HRT74_09385 [Flavobacteriales bacterium]|nr:hypothetical protein [Flavobacteriales bacterium]
MYKTLLLIIALLLGISFNAFSSPKTIHVMVALCDNQYQGIVPVPESIGNGQNPRNNLYWGCGYGVKGFFTKKTTEWNLVQSVPNRSEKILESLLFKHATEDCYMLAEAFDGRNIKECMEDVLHASSGKLSCTISLDNRTSLSFGGNADLIAYIGHNGLMDTEIDVDLSTPSETKDLVLLGCYTHSYFKDYVKETGANPILWTTHLMAPEAYSLHAAIQGWLKNETNDQIEERAAQAYNQYQKCGIKGARNLMKAGF